jgi:hypothetical protein
MKTILPARYGSNLLKRRDAAALIIHSLGASVAGMQRYFHARDERIGAGTVFASTRGMNLQIP